MNQEFSPGRALLWAAGVAAALLVVVVMPAEYGIDWTGAGRVLGLTPMGEQKVAAGRSFEDHELRPRGLYFDGRSEWVLRAEVGQGLVEQAVPMLSFFSDGVLQWRGFKQ